MNSAATLALWAAVIVVASNCGALRLPDVGHTLSLPSTAASEARLAHKSRSHANYNVLMQVSLWPRRVLRTLPTLVVAVCQTLTSLRVPISLFWS